MYFGKQILRRLKYTQSRWLHTEEISTPESTPIKKQSHPKLINSFFQENKEIGELKQYIPPRYLKRKRKNDPEHLYLICPNVAKSVASYLTPVILNQKSDQVICETNAGLGLIATELLEGGVKSVRLYESCAEFREGLKDFGSVYQGRVELFTKDIFLINRYAYMDKHDRANRVEYLFKNVPKRSWEDEPAMTIIGPMTTLSFIRYLIESLVLQNEIVHYGRIQLFAMMKPRYYAVLTATPSDNLHAYQSWTILFQLLFDCELLDKFPRNVFLPWEASLSENKLRNYPGNLEPDKMYLVKINFKKTLPIATEYLLPLFYFARQFYGRGSNKVIPIVEKWVPGCGLNIIVPKLKHADYFHDIEIFTRFRELNPQQILAVFKEMINYPSYTGSPFTALIENELLKLETVETSLSEATQLEKNIAKELEEKLDEK